MNQKILNVGCSNNTYGTHFIDLYPVNEKIKKWDANKDKIPFKDNYFDEVLCSCFLEHVHNARVLIEDMLRVLKGGVN